MKTTLALTRLSNQRGSVILVALILAAVIAISLGSYISLANTTSRIAYRGHYAGVAMNAAESGLEQAMWAINKRKADTSFNWASNGWNTESGDTARQTFSLGTVSGGGVVQVKVLISDRHLSTNNPYAIARAIVTPPRGAAVEKWIKISLSQRVLAPMNNISRRGTDTSGSNVSFESYNSANGAYTPAPSTINRFARGRVGTTSLNGGSLDAGNSKVYGYINVGTKDTSGLDIGSQGLISGNFNAPAKTKDMSRVTTNFKANFSNVTAPDTESTSLNVVNSSITLPKNSATDEYTVDDDGIITYHYSATEISLTDATITISPGYNVSLTVSGDIKLAGHGAINVKSKNTASTTLMSSLNIYLAGDLSITGNSATIGNTVDTDTTTVPNRPKNLMIWGTSTTSQNIKVAGNGALSAVVYAPNAQLEIKGNGEILGAFVADTTKFTGNAIVVFDESLLSEDFGSSLGIENWDEFVSSVDRASLGNLMDF